jgi:hypothetical protein
MRSAREHYSVDVQFEKETKSDLSTTPGLACSQAITVDNLGHRRLIRPRARALHTGQLPSDGKPEVVFIYCQQAKVIRPLGYG